MGKRFITALLALLLVGVQVFAQSAVSGKVTDETGEPCVGANVLIKGTTSGTMTDFDGNYSLPHVKQGAILVISSIGYTTQEVKVGSSAVINVVLQSDNRYLDEVVVVAYGTQKKKDVTGSITDVKSEIVAIQNTTTVSRALEPLLVFRSQWSMASLVMTWLSVCVVSAPPTEPLPPPSS